MTEAERHFALQLGQPGRGLPAPASARTEKLASPGGYPGAAKQKGERARIRVVRSVQEIEEIRDIWTAWLWHPNAEIELYLRVLHSEPGILRPHALVLYRDHRPVAMLVGRLLQTQIETRLGYSSLIKTQVRSLTFIYGGQAGDLSVENSRILIAEVMRSLREGEADLAAFRFVKTDSPFYELLSRSPGFFTRDRFPQAQPHWSLKLPKSVEEFHSSIPAHQRRELRRRTKLLNADYSGNVRIEYLGPACDLDRMFRDLEEVAKMTYQRGLGGGFVDNEEARRQFEYEARRGWPRTYILYIADKPCAFWMGSLRGDVFYSRYGAYDPIYRKYELGKQLLIRVIEDLCRDHVKEMDFGAGDEEWKPRFGNCCWKEATVHIFAPTFKGLAISALRLPAIFVSEGVRRVLKSTQILPRLKRLQKHRLWEAAKRASPRI
jgi:Acetyltransferase (GNAT) domain